MAACNWRYGLSRDDDSAEVQGGEERSRKGLMIESEMKKKDSGQIYLLRWVVMYCWDWMWYYDMSSSKTMW